MDAVEVQDQTVLHPGVRAGEAVEQAEEEVPRRRAIRPLPMIALKPSTSTGRPLAWRPMSDGATPKPARMMRPEETPRRINPMVPSGPVGNGRKTPALAGLGLPKA